jgi:hypothetical protein
MGTISLCFPERETEEFLQMVKDLREYYEEKINGKFGDKTFKWGYDGPGRHRGKRYKIRRKRITDDFAIRQAIQQHWEEILRLRTIEKIKRAKAEVYECEPSEPRAEERMFEFGNKTEPGSPPSRKKKPEYTEPATNSSSLHTRHLNRFFEF